MTVLLDTSVLVAFLHAGDPQHTAADRLMTRVLRGELGVPVSCDYVLDEGLTVLRRKVGRREVSQKFAAMFTGTEDRRAPLTVRFLARDHVLRALELHFEHFERGLSFTDCAVVALAEELGAPVASFDKGFDGIVPRVAS